MYYQMSFLFEFQFPFIYLLIYHAFSQLNRLQEENDSLVGKHSKHSQQLQEESINLPNNLEV